MASQSSLDPFKPSQANPFDSVKAAHLLNRAGFGGTAAEVNGAVALGAQGAVGWLLDFPDKSAAEQSTSDVPDLGDFLGNDPSADPRKLRKKLAGKTAEEKAALKKELGRGNHQALMVTLGWWMRRMAAGPHPLQEKLTLFWHGHFTSSAKDERLAFLMWNQNETLRRGAAGNFGDLVRAISRDPAMLDYLNNNQNRKGHPNENYARELMELFTLGIGNYTEKDVKESARAFTGWGHDGIAFVDRRRLHDTGLKTFLGRTGDFDGDDIINIILAQPACPHFIATELYTNFVREDADPVVVDALAMQLRKNQFALRPTLRTLFTSQAFYDASVIGSQIKCPVQLVVGAVRQLGIEMPPYPTLYGALDQMGQSPMFPPNVRGWPGGRSWINASTLFMRYNMVVRLAGGNASIAGGGSDKKLSRFSERASKYRPTPYDTSGAQSVDQCVDLWVSRLISRPIDPDKRQILVGALDGQPQNPAAIRRMVQLIVSMPEYQLC